MSEYKESLSGQAYRDGKHFGFGYVNRGLENFEEIRDKFGDDLPYQIWRNELRHHDVDVSFDATYRSQEERDKEVLKFIDLCKDQEGFEKQAIAKFEVTIEEGEVVEESIKVNYVK